MHFNRVTGNKKRLTLLMYPMMSLEKFDPFLHVISIEPLYHPSNMLEMQVWNKWKICKK